MYPNIIRKCWFKATAILVLKIGFILNIDIFGDKNVNLLFVLYCSPKLFHSNREVASSRFSPKAVPNHANHNIAIGEFIIATILNGVYLSIRYATFVVHNRSVTKAFNEIGKIISYMF